MDTEGLVTIVEQFLRTKLVESLQSVKLYQIGDGQHFMPRKILRLHSKARRGENVNSEGWPRVGLRFEHD